MKSPKSLLITLLALTTLGGAALAWKQYQELILLRASALNADERADLQKKLWDAEKRAKDLADQLAAARNGGDDAMDAPGDAVAANDTPANNRGNRRQRGGPGGFGGPANMMAIMQKPEVQKLLAVQQKAQLDTRYAALFKSLNLSPEQLDKFKNLLVERQTSMMDVMSAAREQGIDPRTDPQGFRTLVAGTQADIDASIKAAIGDAAYADYKNYDKTAPQRTTVDQLQQSLSYTASPLTSDQAAKMVQILSQTTPQRAATATAGATATVSVQQDVGGGGGGGMRVAIGMGGGGGFGQQTSPITNETVTLAQGVLTTSQLTALQQLQQAQQAQQQINQLARQNAAANNTNNTGSTTTPTTKKTGKGGG